MSKLINKIIKVLKQLRILVDRETEEPTFEETLEENRKVKLAVLEIAKEKNDPMYLEVLEEAKRRREKRNAIIKKYKENAELRAKKLISEREGV